ncbi:MAG: hypothetical protein RL591_1303, partial [Planctomycetota bacterium]
MIALIVALFRVHALAGFSKGFSSGISSRISVGTFVGTFVTSFVLADAPVLAQTDAVAPTPRMTSRPNIVLIYADDVGFGDLSCQGATTIATPNIDRIAREGLRATDAHSAAATCTPSRYALLTGEYAFRRKGTGVLPGNATLIIEPSRATLPSMLRSVGYHSAVIGKWHLGLGAGAPMDWNGEIKPGPLEIGFDQCFLVPATGDRVPCVYVRDHRVVGWSADDPI